MPCSQNIFKWVLLCSSPFLHSLWKKLDKLSQKNCTLVRMFSCSDHFKIYCLNFTVGGLNFRGWNLMGFLKVLWKYALKWTRYLISIFIVSFNLYEHILVTLEKRKTNFPQLYSWSSLFCHYGISCITKPFCPETLRYLWDGFCWNPYWNRCEHRDGRVSKSKWEALDVNRQSHVISGQHWKVLSIYWNCEWMEVGTRNSVSLLCQIYFPIVIGVTHTNFKMFSQWTHMQCI